MLKVTFRNLLTWPRTRKMVITVLTTIRSFPMIAGENIIRRALRRVPCVTICLLGMVLRRFPMTAGEKVLRRVLRWCPVTIIQRGRYLTMILRRVSKKEFLRMQLMYQKVYRDCWREGSKKGLLDDALRREHKEEGLREQVLEESLRWNFREGTWMAETCLIKGMIPFARVPIVTLLRDSSGIHRNWLT